MASNTLQKVITPIGELLWVVISGEGKENMSGKMQYVATIAFDPKQAEWAELQAAVKKFWADNKPKGLAAAKSTGFYEELVDTGETDEDGKKIKKPTGRMLLSFKTGTVWKDGKPVIVPVANSKGKTVALGDKKIGNGSMGRVKGAYDIYTNKLPSGKIVDGGVTFYLSAIQITKFVEYNTGAGFDSVDDGEGWTGDDFEEDFADDIPTEAPSMPRL